MGDLTHNKPFESEVRFSVADIGAFRQRVAAINPVLVREYSFTDFYYKPVTGEWNSLEKSLRIRQYRMPDKPTTVYFSRNEIYRAGPYTFKRSVYEQGKLTLYTGDIAVCRGILTDLGFAPAYAIDKRAGWIWKVPDKRLEFCVEDTDALGWTGEMELEGTDPSTVADGVKRHQQWLGIPDGALSYKPVAVQLEEASAAAAGNDPIGGY